MSGRVGQRCAAWRWRPIEFLRALDGLPLDAAGAAAWLLSVARLRQGGSVDVGAATLAAAWRMDSGRVAAVLVVLARADVVAVEQRQGDGWRAVGVDDLAAVAGAGAARLRVSVLLGQRDLREREAWRLATTTRKKSARRRGPRRARA